jgi:hypothetical protein
VFLKFLQEEKKNASLIFFLLSFLVATHED